jgi:hypothetical protein
MSSISPCISSGTGIRLLKTEPSALEIRLKGNGHAHYIASRLSCENLPSARASPTRITASGDQPVLHQLLGVIGLVDVDIRKMQHVTQLQA